MMKSELYIISLTKRNPTFSHKQYSLPKLINIILVVTFRRSPPESKRLDGENVTESRPSLMQNCLRKRSPSAQSLELIFN
jgi:hypothetical protein